MLLRGGATSVLFAMVPPAVRQPGLVEWQVGVTVTSVLPKGNTGEIEISVRAQAIEGDEAAAVSPPSRRRPGRSCASGRSRWR